MSGVAIIMNLLTTNGPLIAAIPATSIYAGDLPLNAPLPGISISQISSVPRNIVSMNEAVGKKSHVDRVQVTVMLKGPEGTPSGAGYPGLRSLLRLVLAACPNTHGTVNTFSVDSIIPDFEGPDLVDPTLAIYSGSRDFFVRWNA